MDERTKKRIAIFGSTGAVGTQALEVIRAHKDKFEVEILTAHGNESLLQEQAMEFQPNAIVIADEKKYPQLKEALSNTNIKVFGGENAIEEVAEFDTYDIMLACIVGFAGLRPILKAIEKGKTIALASKEALVVAGDLIMQLAVEKRVPILPVGSEHSAIFQCLIGETRNRIEKVILTASGGPFRGKKPNFLVNVKKHHALENPSWNMGAKITVDSATLMNKGMSMIEARWLFNLEPDQIEVLLHPQCIIHSMVQFEDGSVKAQMGMPDMRIPIQYALGFPKRLPSEYPRINFRRLSSLEFEEPDIKTFRNLALAHAALEKGGNVPAVLNAANEIAVWAFLNNRVGFLDMTAIVEKTMENIAFIEKPNLTDYFESDGEARNFAASLIHL